MASIEEPYAVTRRFLNNNTATTTNNTMIRAEQVNATTMIVFRLDSAASSLDSAKSKKTVA